MKSKFTLVLIALFATAFAYANDGKKDDQNCHKEKDCHCDACKEHGKKCDHDKDAKKDCPKDDAKKDEAKKE